jgi:DNA-binding transcriptional LysR family regulator
MPISWSYLRYFVAVADDGQMTRAAERLHIAQPALSQAIAQLESELGVQLLERRSSGIGLTPSGAAFLEKARPALAAAEDTALTARSLARAAEGAVEFGFLGAPPPMHSPELVDEFMRRNPMAELRFTELQFPSGSAESWLGAVDVTLANMPPSGPEIWIQPLREEPRVIIAPRDHPLAGRESVAVEEALDQEFLGRHPLVDPRWAGFWSLDDHRGGPPALTTADRPANTQELFALISAGRGMTTVPACHAAVVAAVLPGVVAIPLTDADPVVFSLAGRADRSSALVESLRDVAREISDVQSAAAALPAEP